MELRHPYAAAGILLLILLYLIFVRKKQRKYTSGSKIANTFFLKNTDYYKKRLRNYRIIRRLLMAFFVVAILASTILIARPYKITTIKKEQYNRDIMLCMDTSTSVDELNSELTESLSSMVDKLNGERFGISIFNTSSVPLVPLTEDYEYVKTVLGNIKKSIDYFESDDPSLEVQDDYYYMIQYIYSGTIEGASERGSSLIGDGLASCVFNFPDLEDKERTRIIIFSTDNDLAGKPLLTTEQASAIAKKKGIKVFGISPRIAEEQNLEEFQQAINLNGGKLYTQNNSTTDNIVRDIEQTTKTLLDDQTETKEHDVPLIPFLLLLIGVCGIIALSGKTTK